MKESISSAFEKFSSKFSRFKNAEEKKFCTQKNPDSILQEKISIAEEERIQKIKEKYSAYENPVSQEIENDEAELLKCLELFKAVEELNRTKGNDKTYIEDFKIHTYLTQKKEYTVQLNFTYLQAWFIKTQNENFIPVLEESKSFWKLNFIPQEDFKPSPLLKEILSI